ncbi:MAG: cobalamin biosynthesis protein, partial [Lachnospiraceae bacterium]|nr:cobalamin biosynthesis protein [Lachnospiraceae bacterium]
YGLGIGCKKGKTFEEVNAFIKEHLTCDMEELFGIASIDLKAREEGIWEFAQYYHLPFETFSAECLNSVEGEFTKSEFVQGITGVDNVCERAALCLAGSGGTLALKKTADQGMTMALSKRKIRLLFE